VQSAEGALLPSRSLGAQAQNWGALCGPGLSRLYTLHRSPKGRERKRRPGNFWGRSRAPVASAPTPSAFPTQPWPESAALTSRESQTEAANRMARCPCFFGCYCHAPQSRPHSSFMTMMRLLAIASLVPRAGEELALDSTKFEGNVRAKVVRRKHAAEADFVKFDPSHSRWFGCPARGSRRRALFRNRRNLGGESRGLPIVSCLRSSGGCTAGTATSSFCRAGMALAVR
jgi:hypothetical protein